MHLGNILSIGKYSQGNLTHIIFNNGLHESTGSHNLVNKNFDYKILKLAGYSKVFQIDTLVNLEPYLKKIKGLNGIIINIDSGTINNLPRPTKKPNQLKFFRILVKAIILAAGLGSRLGDLTKYKPKSLIKIGSKTLLERLTKQLEDLGVNKIQIICGHEKNR